MAKTLSVEQIEHINLQYLPRLTLANVEEYLEKSAERSARVRKKLACEIDVAYGDTPGQTLDIFPAKTKGAPVHIFIHGGYWRSLDKHIYSHVAGPMVAALGGTADQSPPNECNAFCMIVMGVSSTILGPARL